MLKLIADPVQPRCVTRIERIAATKPRWLPDAVRVETRFCNGNFQPIFGEIASSREVRADHYLWRYIENHSCRSQVSFVAHSAVAQG